MSIKLLKEAYELSTQGEWKQGDMLAPNMASVGTGDGGWLGLAQMFGDSDEEARGNALFTATAHNLMPLLLSAVELVEQVALGNTESDVLAWNAQDLVKKLKGSTGT